MRENNLADGLELFRHAFRLCFIVRNWILFVLLIISLIPSLSLLLTCNDKMLFILLCYSSLNAYSLTLGFFLVSSVPFLLHFGICLVSYFIGKTLSRFGCSTFRGISKEIWGMIFSRELLRFDELKLYKDVWAVSGYIRLYDAFFITNLEGFRAYHIILYQDCRVS